MERVTVQGPLGNQHRDDLWYRGWGTASDVLEWPYTVGGGGVPPLTPPTSLLLDPLPLPPSLLL